jgi:predicted O-methyltransferase YrrM
MIEYKSEFQQILEMEGGPVEYELFIRAPNLKMKHQHYPHSIRETEFNYLRDIVVRYNLKSGLEIATAFGVSAVASGLGFRETGGRLITIDAYIEESSNDCYIYDGLKQVYENTSGYKSRSHLVNFFGLNDHVKLEVGWSPDDVGSILEKNNVDKLDFVFLDGGHFPDQIIKDIGAFYPYLSEKNIVVLHDVMPDSYTSEVLDFIQEKFGKQPQVILPRPMGDFLSVINNFN